MSLGPDKISTNRLQLKTTKTEVIWFATNRRQTKLPTSGLRERESVLTSSCPSNQFATSVFSRQFFFCIGLHKDSVAIFRHFPLCGNFAHLTVLCPLMSSTCWSQMLLLSESPPDLSSFMDRQIGPSLWVAKIKQRWRGDEHRRNYPTSEKVTNFLYTT